MKTILAIASNELRRLFLSPFPWVILGTVQFLLAIFFYVLLSKYMEPAPWHAGRGLTEIVVIGLLQITGLVMLLITPFITMRLISEELRSGTMKLLLSSPVSITELVLGKYLGVMLYFLVLLVQVALMPLSLFFGTSLDPGLLLAGMLALILLASTLAAAGLFISSLSRTPALAAVSSFFCTFLLWIIHVASDPVNERLEPVIIYMSLQKHFNALLSGAFNSSDVVYYLLLTTLFLILGIWRLDALRTHQ